MYKPQHVSTFDFVCLFFQGFLVTWSQSLFVCFFSTFESCFISAQREHIRTEAVFSEFQDRSAVRV